ncbi:hypothetical protein BA953_17130 [Vibrio coralliilyticus]|uniref:hypothetical protein n=1 Tax=Vibrio coralliilyticus TaxID=190893 RepID=UPI000810BED5|nr:hypothetical protein [Vibrio coralliilyticus]ANW25914.1 hypothetical protein BA953_17130 [Vibrio coralliilyticus]
MSLTWKDVLGELQQSVPSGTITTYGDLSQKFYGHSRGALSIKDRLKEAVNSDRNNALYTNRVVGSEGQLIINQLVDDNGQQKQLVDEGVPISGGNVNLKQAKKAVLS